MPNLINSKTVFIATIIVIPTLTLIVYITGLKAHRTLYLNSLLSTTILSIIFLTFITTGLYCGWKLKDGLGNLLDKFHLWKKPTSPKGNFGGFDGSILNGIDGIDLEGCLVILILWIVVGLFGSIILWYLGAIIWATILMIGGILYWIIFRAFRFIFRNSARCQGNFIKSIGIAIVFTVLYNFWIYAIIYGVHFLRQ